MNIGQKMQEFDALDQDKQVQLCTKILSSLADRGNEDAQRILPQMKNSQPEPQLLTRVYENFLKSVSKTEEKKQQAEVANYEKGQQYIMDLHRKEQQARNKEIKEAEINFQDISTEDSYATHQTVKKSNRRFGYLITALLCFGIGFVLGRYDIATLLDFITTTLGA